MESSETIAGDERKCIVPSCGKDFQSESTSYSSHSFPKDYRLRLEWVKALASSDRSFLDRAIDFNSARICSAHFTVDSFQKTGDRKVLQATSVPTLFGSAVVKDGKQDASQNQQSPNPGKQKICSKTAQQQMKKLIEEVLSCSEKFDQPNPVKTPGTVFRLKRFPHVCRLCLKPKKNRFEVMIPLDATDYVFDGDTIGEFIFDILPPGATLDQDKQHLLPNAVCQPCLELLKFFAKFRSKLTMVHLLMNSLVELKHFNSRPIVDLFSNKADSVRTVIKDLGLCRLKCYSVDDLIDEFPMYDLASFEGFVIKDEEEEEEALDQTRKGEPEVELKELPTEVGEIYAEECTPEEIIELTKDHSEMMVQEVEDGTPAVKKKSHVNRNADEYRRKRLMRSKGDRTKGELLQCHKCSYSTHVLYSYRSHQLTHEMRENRRYHCKHPDCSAVFKTSAESYRHSSTVHKSFVCETCGQKCSTRYALATHMERHSKTYEHACPYCEQRRSTKSDLRQHVRKVHFNLKNYSCEACGMVFHTKKTRDEHERTHSDTYGFPCAQCDKKFKRELALKNHVKIIHENYRVSCSHCNGEFSSTYKLNNHIECVHGIQTRFVCDICVFTLLSQEKLDLHRAQHDNPHELQCGTCLVVFPTLEEFAGHLCITYRDDYVCCGRDFRYHYMYNKHMMMKHGLKTNVRVKPVPGQLMGQMRALRKRIETCPKCEQVFATRTLKKQHVDNCTGVSDAAEHQEAIDALMAVESTGQGYISG